MSIWKRPKGLEWAAALLLFLMLREWLLPLAELTDTGTLWPFYMIVAGILLIDLVVPYRWLTFPVKLVGILWILHADFSDTSFFSTEWLSQIYLSLQRDIPLALQQNWTEMLPLTRNLLFDLMLALLISMVTYLVLEQRQGLWFVFLTELYLAVLDTFLPFEADGAIIRTLIYGFLLLAVAHVFAISKQAPLVDKRRWTLWKALIAPVLVVAIAAGVAYAGPKKDPSWPDPIAFLTGSGNGPAIGTMKKVGYDNNDENLGGPFQQDDTLVFVGVTNERTYWRGDSKDMYTGRGWQKGEREYQVIENPPSYLWKNMLYRGPEMKDVTATLDFSKGERFATLFYPGQLKRVVSIDPSQVNLVYDSNHQQVEIRAVRETRPRPVEQPGESSPIIRSREAIKPPEQQVAERSHVALKPESYQLEVEVPIISEKAIMQVGMNYPDEVKQRYLQVPEELPQRVKDLAKSITEKAPTPYEKVRAIENYLRTGGEYKYETKDVPVPAPGQDFVDHFLFDSHRGYCDHFSTSMAVMLRSVGIPARWVKGFAPGTVVGKDGLGNDIVEVRNKDAHSWVEVYFPGQGWIPFEATSTFVSPVRIKYDLYTGDQETSLPIPNLGEQPSRNRGDGRMDELEGADAVGKRSWKIPGPVKTIGVAIVVAGAYLAWRRRGAITLWWLQRKMRNHPNELYEDRYNLLMQLVQHVHSRREPGETLREYVKRIELTGDKRQDLQYLTHWYERVHYGCREMEEKARAIAHKIMERLSQQLKP
ncbi:DUF3488 and transglutaminase-like domain-containing protein [Brevibacillus ruminantium]|uniref:DUF3488 and transglutaminase-like domain-containing protein n=1 Tax=Brevibacillus ruminantium TaxID=2950604 RepID=A0ABY4WGU4_9BACL|nr:transglutaminase domain-containing protein [Brevibacillus ruminantium]USG66375.1 DUF3488 and transglutaminase-like domain-containing protein [Brevibacillus ruminantium]